MPPKESKARGHLEHNFVDPVYRGFSVEATGGFATADPLRSLSSAPRFGSGSEISGRGKDFSSLGKSLPFSVKSGSVSSGPKSFEALEPLMTTKSADTKAPLPIQDCPSYFESNSSFITTKPPASIFESIICLFKEKRVDYEFQPYKHRLKGVTYNPDDCNRCTFKLKVFKAPLGRTGKYLVEFQRRCGCVVTFRNFYKQILQALSVEGVVVSTSGVSFALSPKILAGGQVRLDQETVDVLIRSLGNLAEPTNLENLRETLRVLATLSKTSHNRAVLAEVRTTAERSGLCDLLLWVLNLEDSEVRRCGTTLLGNVAALETIRGELVSKLLASMFRLLSSTDSDVTEFDSCDLIEKEIQRQVAKTLAILTETHASEIAKDVHFSHYMQVLGKHKSSPDEGLRADVLSTIQRLVVAENPITSR
jgi:hypothetical protein